MTLAYDYKWAYNELLQSLILLFKLVDGHLLLFNEIDGFLSEQLFVSLQISKLFLLFKKLFLFFLELLLIDEFIAEHFLFLN